MKIEASPRSGNFLALSNEEALEIALRDDWTSSRSREFFFRLLIASSVYLFPAAPLPADQALRAGSEMIDVLTWVGSGGETVLPIFTSLAALRSAPRGRAAFVTMPFLTVLRSLHAEKILLNAGSQQEHEFTAAQMITWLAPGLDDAVFIVSPTNPSMFVSRQPALSAFTEQTLRLFCQAESSVRLAYVNGLRENVMDAPLRYRVTFVVRGLCEGLMQRANALVLERNTNKVSFEYALLRNDGSELETEIQNTMPLYRRLERISRPSAAAPDMASVSFLKKIERVLSFRKK